MPTLKDGASDKLRKCKSVRKRNPRMGSRTGKVREPNKDIITSAWLCRKFWDINHAQSLLHLKAGELDSVSQSQSSTTKGWAQTW